MSNSIRTLREQLASINHKKRQPIVVPEWATTEAPEGVTLYAVTLSAKSSKEYIKALEAHPDESSNAVLAIYGLEDAEGRPVWTLDDLPTVTNYESSILSRLTKRVNDIQPSITDAKKN